MGGAAASRQMNSRPPEKGSFPLDHFNECTKVMEGYLACMKANQSAHASCRDETKKYLECRMEYGLMSREKLANFGLEDKIDYKASAQAQAVYEEERNRKYEGGFVAGMGRAKGQGGMFKDKEEKK